MTTRQISRRFRSRESDSLACSTNAWIVTFSPRSRRRRLGWAFVLIGPVTKISPDDLPRAPNLHYLGPKSYDELPRYIAGWDVAMMPFAMNAATKYISPTKTPEYLAAGKASRVHADRRCGADVR